MPPILSPVEAQFVSSSMPVDDAVDSAVSRFFSCSIGSRPPVGLIFAF